MTPEPVAFFQNNAMECSNCGKQNPEDHTFCGQCGHKLEFICPSCGKANALENNFCGGCGQKLSLGQPESSPTPPSPATSPSLEGERRHATIVFSDLSGYTAMSERLDPEEVQAIMSRIKAEAIRIVEHHGGTVNQFIGDEVVALFGIPMAHEDDPIRAVRAVMELHGLVRQMSERVAEQIGQPLRMHTGINTGLIVTHLEDDRDGKFGLTGDTVNTGARLLAQAATDEILVSPDTRHRIVSHFALDALPAVAMKGKAKPMIPYRVVRELEAPLQTSQPFIGRQAELQQFREIVEPCQKNRKGAALLIRGNAGIGKSRLVEELRAIAAEHQFACHKGLVLDFGVGQNRDAIRTIVNSLLQLEAHSSQDTLQNAAEKAISDGLVAPEHRAFLYDLLDLPQSAALSRIYDAMDNETRNQGKLETVAELVKQVSQHHPLMLIIEDTHWADPLTLAYLSQLTATVPEIPALLVMTTRLEGDKLDATWQENLPAGVLTTVNLTPFGKEEALAMASEFFNVTQRTAADCVERAEGNPLFLEQLLLSAEESREESVPGSIQSLILARLDRLKPLDKLAIQAASIQGQRFSLDLVRTLIANPEYDYQELVAHQLIRPEGGDFLFAHALVQEGVYFSLLKSKRRLLHKTAAVWFEGIDLELAAEHFERAEDQRAAQTYWKAAEAQVSKYHYSRALQLVESGIRLADNPSLQEELMCFQGQILQDMGATEPSIETYRQTLEMSKDEIIQARALIGMAGGMRVLGKYEDGLTALDQAEALVARNDLTHELAKLHHLRGNLYFPLAKIDEVLKHHDLSRRYARQIQSTELEAMALGGLGDAYYSNGRMKTANEHFRQCVELSHQHGFNRIEVANLPMVGHSYMYVNQFEAALEAGRKGAEIAKQVNHQRAEIVSRMILANILHELGHFPEAKVEIDHILALQQRIETRMWDGITLCFLGKAEFQQGNYSRAMDLIQQALEACRHHGMGFYGAAALGALAELTDDPVKGRAALEEGEVVLQQKSLSHSHLGFYRSAIEASLRFQDWDNLERYAQGLETYTHAEPLPWSHFFIARGRALSAFGKGMREELLFDTLRGLLQEAGSVGFTLAIPALESALLDS